jgi:NAD(P)-dependent dehydrogenase (short-subunit alcohol dehydrogenase family)
LGHFFLTSLLMDLVKKSEFFRIINIASRAHKGLAGFGPNFSIDWNNMNFTVENSYEHTLAYSRSKLCNVLFTKGLAARIPSTKGICASLHPGVVNT